MCDARLFQLEGLWRVGFLAMRTHDTNEALGKDAHDRRGNEEGLDPHVNQPCHGAWGIVRVQCRKDEVARQRGLDCDLGRFGVPDFAYHDHVGVLAKDRAQSACKRKLNLGIDLNLAYAWELVLDGIFNCNDIFFCGINMAERGIQRGRLSRACRACHEDDAMASCDKPLDGAQPFLAQA